jgi:hypothetical protein
MRFDREGLTISVKESKEKIGKEDLIARGT